MTRRLIEDFPKDGLNKEQVADVLRLAAYNAEQALLDSGAVPGKDYNLLDLYRLAAPLFGRIIETHPGMGTNYYEA